MPNNTMRESQSFIDLKGAVDVADTEGNFEDLNQDVRKSMIRDTSQYL